MIELKQDCLAIDKGSGGIIPCVANAVTVELIGLQSSTLDPELVEQMTAAVLHYFKRDLGRETVSLEEFARALEQVFRGLGLEIKVTGAESTPPSEQVFNLCQLINPTEPCVELSLFPKLRHELHRQLQAPVQIIRFTGLRTCVKSLIGVKRWNKRCGELHDQIVSFLRECYVQEPAREQCALVVE